MGRDRERRHGEAWRGHGVVWSEGGRGSRAHSLELVVAPVLVIAHVLVVTCVLTVASVLIVTRVCSQYFTVPHLFLQESGHSSGIPVESSGIPVLCLGPDYSLFILILHIKVFTILKVHTCASFVVKIV